MSFDSVARGTETMSQVEMRIIILNRLRRLYKKVFGHPACFYNPDGAYFHYLGQAASNLIRQTLEADKPCMICRMGATEMNAVLTYLAIRENSNRFSKSIRYIRGQLPCFWWDEKTIKGMSNNAGFFPSNGQNLVRYSQRILQDVHNVDILGSWIRSERELFRYNTNIKTVRLLDLEPYRHTNPWSDVLEGKRVLIVHPFEESIRRQYAKRQLLFRDQRVLPEFEMITLKAVQSIAGNPVPFADWFEALDWMCQKINNINFDIALIGAGAYGFPLAAHIKRIGKKAVHLGGATQLLFGIRGARWDKDPFVSGLHNEHWIRPSSDEIPENAHAVEHGCYW